MHLSGTSGLLTGLGICFLALLVGNVQANGWGDAAEMEMYDLIEELGKNFYDFLEIPAVSVKWFRTFSDVIQL